MSRKQFIFLAVLLFAAGFFWYATFLESERSLRLIVLNVGQGDAIFIETPEGNQILIDGGYGGQVLRELGEVMPPYDKSLDVVIATHTDSDHIGGLRGVIEAYDIGLFIENGFRGDSQMYRDMQALLRTHHIATTTVGVGDQITFGSRVLFDVFGPFPEDATNIKQPNETMIVGRLHFGDASAFLAGDIEKGDELRLALSLPDIQSDVLKVAHHGSLTSSTKLLLDRIAPKHAAISVGSDNRYGHPHQEIIKRLEAMGIYVTRTDRDGRTEFRSTGGDFKLR